ncbi:MAG: nucleotidyltransferase domain-containing protein [candidate division KSB1 bacterium]|nr:nucleotidyltransferase domain-containing protein [candidate division KSB1 bacterium]MDZ7366583.1 nucleotidyltransferase domain-containing protein [candidate division KSB1 bacterium]MDZ7406699.1 nucleotidyltransferase domain-containing protein [candidate division KSB1 bacterium]
MSEHLQTTPENKPDYSSYIAGWKRRQQQEKAAIETRRSRARQIAMRATEILKHHGATKVILFGSVLDHTFKLDSDIDIAVDMPSAAWWEWYLKLGEVLQFPIDLVHLDKINEGFREIIFQFGEVLYDQEERRCRTTGAD